MWQKMLAVLIGLVALPAAHAAPIQYVYDPLGRLMEVSAPDGTSGQYAYDAAGNIFAINSRLANTLSLTAFFPSAGPVGTRITLYGSGFNTTPANNIVKINGVAAAVVTSTANALTLTVPAAATSGPISVSNTSGSVTSAAAFTVGTPLPADETPLALNLSARQTLKLSFQGSAGQGFGIGVTGLVSNPAGGNVTIQVLQPSGSLLAACAAANDTGCILPYLPATGNYTISITAGASALAMNLALHPDRTANILANVATTFTADAVGLAATFAFNGSAGQGVGFLLSGDTFVGTTDFTVYRSDGSQVATTALAYSTGPATAGAFAITSLPATDLYRLRIMPRAGITGSAVVNFKPEANASLNIDGAATAATLLAGQNGRYTFVGASGQRLGLGITAIATSPANAALTANIVKPDGTSLGTFTASSAKSFPLPPLPANGTYAVLVSPGIVAANFKLQLSADLVATLVVNGAASVFTASKLGQNASYGFTGTAGQDASLVLSADSLQGTSSVVAYRPDGAQLATTSLTYTVGAATATTLNLGKLPATGTYTARVMPPAVSSGSISVAVAQEATGNLSIDGAATAVNLASAQSGRYTFGGVVGQRLGLGVTAVATTPANGSIAITIIKPDGSNLGTFTAYTTTAYALPPLPAAGTYTVVVAPGNKTASLKLQLCADATGTLAVGATTAIFNATKVGQNASYSFSASAGQSPTLTLSNDTLVGTTSVVAYKPDGSQLATGSVTYSSDRSLPLLNLPATGAYSVRLVTPAVSSGSISLGLRAELSGTLTADAAPINVSLQANQNGRISFAGTAGQRLGLGAPELTTIPASGTVAVTIVKPDGGNLASFTAYTGSYGLSLPLLPVTGTYTVLLSPGAYAASFKLQLSSDLSGTLTVGGPSLHFDASRVGQSASYSFSASAGQNVAISITDILLQGFTYFKAYKPDGSLLAQTSFTPSGAASPGSSSLRLENLPVSGTYLLRVQPLYWGGSVSLAAKTDLGGNLSIDGAAIAANLSPGQNAQFSFVGTAGQRLGLGLTAFSATPPYGNATVAVLKPDGSSLVSFVTTATGGIALPPLPVSGGYTAVIKSGSYGINATLQLASDVAGNLAANGPSLAIASTKIGQSASAAFSATAGQSYTLTLSGDNLPNKISLSVFQPDGTPLPADSISYASGTANSLVVSLAALPATGNHILRLVPQAATLGSITLNLQSAVSGVLLADAPATVVNLAEGQGASYTFSGTAGQHLGLGITGLTTTLPSNATLTATVVKPDGSVLGSFTAAGDAVNYALPFLPATGIYSLRVAQNSRSARFNLQLNSDLSASLVADGSLQSFRITRLGQNGSYSFTAVAGQNLNLVFTNDTLPLFTAFSAYRPDGKEIATTSLLTLGGVPSQGSLALNNLPLSGTYCLRIAPSSTAGAVTVALNVEAVGALLIDTEPSVVKLATGQSGRYSFAGTQGQRLGLAVSGLVTAPIGMSVLVSILKPDGTSLGAFNVPGQNAYALPALPVSGTYSVLLSTGIYSTTLSLQLNSDAGGSLSADGAPATFAVNRIGQYASYNFSGVAGQSPLIALSGDTLVGSTNVYVYKPDGTPLNYTNVNYASGAPGRGSIRLINLPVSGTYSVRILPPAVTSGSITIALQTQTVLALAIDSAPVNFSLAPNQSMRFTFNGSPGQALGLAFNWHSSPFAPIGGPSINIYKPDGSEMLPVFGGNSATATANGYSSYALPPLPTAGTYTVLATGSAAYPSDYSVQLNSDFQGSLSVNGPVVSFREASGLNPVPWRAGSYTFTAIAGQRYSLGLSGPDGSEFHIYDPAGTPIADSYVALDLPPATTTGTYTIRAIPPYSVWCGGMAGCNFNDVVRMAVSAHNCALSVSSAVVEPGASVNVTIAGIGLPPDAQAYFSGTANGGSDATHIPGGAAPGSFTLSNPGTRETVYTRYAEIYSLTSGSICTTNTVTFAFKRRQPVAAYVDLVQTMYIAYLGRPADPTGLSYWTNDLAQSGGNPEALLNGLWTAASGMSLYDQVNSSANINQLYRMVLGRDADPGGLAYWSNEIASGRLPLYRMPYVIAATAKSGGDGVIAAKVTAATAFTAHLDSLDETLNYEKYTAIGRTWLSPIVDSAGAAAAIAGVDAFIAGL